MLRQIFLKLANDVKKYPNIVQLTKTLDEGFRQVSEQINDEPYEVDDVPTSGSNNPVSSNGVYTSEQDIYKVIGKDGAKNRLPLTLANLKDANTSGTWEDNVYTIGNVIFTVNQDSNGNVIFIKVTGSDTGGSAKTLNIPFNWIANNQYIFNGCPSGGTSNSYRIDIYDETDNLVSGIYDYGNGNTYTPSASGTGKLRLRLSGSYTIPTNALTFYPMIRLAYDNDPTYQPYAMTNNELTVKVAPMACDKTTAGTYTLSATVDSDGNVTYTWS